MTPHELTEQTVNLITEELNARWRASDNREAFAVFLAAIVRSFGKEMHEISRDQNPPAKITQLTPLPQGYRVVVGRDVCGSGPSIPRPVMIPSDKGEWINRFDVERLIVAMGGRFE